MYRQTITSIRHNKTYCTLIATMILASYSLSLVKEIDDKETYPDYFDNILPLKMYCNYDFNSHIYAYDGSILIEGSTQRGFLKYWANCFSYQYIGNDRVLPIIFSITIVYLTYVLGSTITNNRIIGLIAMGTMSVNPLLTKFDSSPTYDQLWAMLFLASVILLYKKSFLGLASFPLSVMSKVLAIGYLPGMIFNIITDNKIKHRKLMLSVCGIIIVFGISYIAYFGVGNNLGIYPDRIIDGFLRIFENIWPIFPFIIGAIVVDRFFLPKEKPEGKRVVLIWLAWILITTPLIYIFTESQYQFGYRFVPFAVFFSIYIGIVGVQLGNFITETRLRKQSLKSIS